MGNQRKKVDVATRAKVKRVRRMGRLLYGRPGQGRKTSFSDRKKQSARLSCRVRIDGET